MREVLVHAQQASKLQIMDVNSAQRENISHIFQRFHASTAKAEKRPPPNRLLVPIVLPASFLQTIFACSAHTENHQLRDRAVVSIVVSGSILPLGIHVSCAGQDPLLHREVHIQIVESVPPASILIRSVNVNPAILERFLLLQA
jgi:hypothetical protein